MQLFTNPGSPFCRKVHIVLLETGQQDDVSEVIAIGHPTDPGSMPVAENPIGKVPTLVLDDGSALYDSRVICRFLDARAKAGLYPEDRLWEVLTLEATGDGICEAAVLMVYENRSRPEAARYPPWVEGQWTKIARALDALESGWMPLLAGPLNAGQVAVASALGYLDFRHAARNWRDGRPALAAWEEEFGRRASIQATIPHAP